VKTVLRKANRLETRFGLPVRVVIETDGTPLATQDTGQLEDGNHHDPAKVKAFLEKWRKPKRGEKF
jgi:hypothetical protein